MDMLFVRGDGVILVSLWLALLRMIDCDFVGVATIQNIASYSTSKLTPASHNRTRRMRVSSEKNNTAGGELLSLCYCTIGLRGLGL